MKNCKNKETLHILKWKDLQDVLLIEKIQLQNSMYSSMPFI